jgi:hypothetical protein
MQAEPARHAQQVAATMESPALALLREPFDIPDSSG